MRLLRQIFIIAALAFSLSAGAQALIQHPWQGKRVAYFGDSITDPRNSGSQRKWWNWLQTWLGIEPYVYAVSGRQWNDIPRQAEQLKTQHGDDFDAILIFIGTNDFNAAVPIGEWYNITEDSVEAAVHHDKANVLRRHRVPSMNNDTYRGRINIAMKRIKEMFPSKQVVLLTPIHRGYFYGNEKNIQPTEAYTNEIGEWVDAYVESVKEAANIWAVPVIDLNATCGFYPLVDEHIIYCHNERDQLHPNDEGHIRMARTVMYQLLALPCTFEK
ncbi:MAG: SGNH/GDSL hydrolase family protein [Prevotella sp.]|nr:SGNH/GDSL hydrolase family protein [Prevotella sp.]